MKVYYAHIDNFDEDFFEKAFKYLPLQKVEQTRRKKNILSQKESLLAWYLLSVGLGSYGIKNREICFSENGKPFLKSGELFFNISHSSGFVCCAFSAAEIGADVEKIRDSKSAVMKRVLCQNEFDLIVKSENKAEDFIGFWTIKESFVKQSGQGISAGFANFDFSQHFRQKSFCQYGLNFLCGKIEDYMYSFCTKAAEKAELVEITERNT